MESDWYPNVWLPQLCSGTASTARCLSRWASRFPWAPICAPTTLGSWRPVRRRACLLRSVLGVRRSWALGKYMKGPSPCWLLANTTLPLPSPMSWPAVDVEKVRGEPICVIGAGPAGLITAHVLLKDGFQNVQVICRDPTVGGVWARGRVYPDMHLNKYVRSFSMPNSHVLTR